MLEATIQTSGLTRRFDALTAVDRLDLTVHRGEIFGLVGPDGAGKTTTLRMLCGLLPPSDGNALILGHDTATDRAAVTTKIGYMGQRFGLYTDLTIAENMEFAADLCGVSRREREALEPSLLKMTRLEQFRGRQAGKLSGGMKQKLALCCALLRRPEVLLLDEPTNGVDPVSRRELWTILYELVKSGMTILVTTAYLDEAERCNRVGLMYRGRMIRCDAPDKLRRGIEGRCLEVRSESPLRPLRARLLESPGVRHAEFAGDSLHVFLSDSAVSVGEWQNRFPGTEFREVVPSLEDAFITLIREREMQAGA